MADNMPDSNTEKDKFPTRDDFVKWLSQAPFESISAVLIEGLSKRQEPTQQIMGQLILVEHGIQE